MTQRECELTDTERDGISGGYVYCQFGTPQGGKPGAYGDLAKCSGINDTVFGAMANFINIARTNIGQPPVDFS